MTKEPAESPDNLGEQVSLETPVYLEIKEKEVIYLFLNAFLCRLSGEGGEKHIINSGTGKCEFSFLFCFMKA